MRSSSTIWHTGSSKFDSISTATKTIKMAIELIVFEKLEARRSWKKLAFTVCDWAKMQKKGKFYLDLPNVCKYPIWNFPIFFHFRFYLLLPFDYICIPFHSNFVRNREKITEGNTDMYVCVFVYMVYMWNSIYGPSHPVIYSPLLCFVCYRWKTKNNLKHRKYAHIVKPYRWGEKKQQQLWINMASRSTLTPIWWYAIF